MGANDAILSLTCPLCGEAFASAMQMDPETFDKMRLGEMLEVCDACGFASRFTKDDYHFSP